jgi:hypothetical protein
MKIIYIRFHQTFLVNVQTSHNSQWKNVANYPCISLTVLSLEYSKHRNPREGGRLETRRPTSFLLASPACMQQSYAVYLISFAHRYYLENARNTVLPQAVYSQCVHDCVFVVDKPKGSNRISLYRQTPQGPTIAPKLPQLLGETAPFRRVKSLSHMHVL